MLSRFMKTPRATFLSVLGLCFVAACGVKASSAVGTYELDKEAFKASMFANVPEPKDLSAEEKKARMDKVAGMVGSSATIELKAGGTATRTSKGMVMQKDATDHGTWKLDGSKLALTFKDAGKDETAVADYTDGSFLIVNGQMRMTFKKK